MLSEINDNTGEVDKRVDILIDNLKKLDCVVGITQSMAMIPYMRDNAWYDSVRIDGKIYRVNYKGAEEEAYKVFLSGRCGGNGSRMTGWRMVHLPVWSRNN